MRRADNCVGASAKSGTMETVKEIFLFFCFKAKVTVTNLEFRWSIVAVGCAHQAYEC